MFRQSFFHCPSSASYSGVECAVADRGAISPLRERKGFSIMGYQDIGASVVLLFLTGSPLAIFLRIPEVIVNPFNGQIFWTFTHVGKEILEAFPMLAYFYASASIIFIAFMVLISASLLHISPYVVSPRFVHSVSNAASIAKARTTAGIGIAGLKVRHFGIDFISAVALTKPMNLFSTRAGKFALIAESYKLPKAMIGYIGKVAHIHILTHVKE